MQRKSKIWVTFRAEGIHCWPDAEQLPGVEFLRHPHRHIFHFKLWIDVKHDDREIEFITFKRELEDLYRARRDLQGVLSLQNKSCEMIADELYKYIIDRYPQRDVIIEISEDGENGCYNEYYA